MGFHSNWENEMGYNTHNLTADSLNLFRLPGRSNSGGVLHDPLFHLNFPPPSPPQPQVFRDLFQSLPHGSLFGDEDGGVCDGDRRSPENGILEFSRDIGWKGKEREGNGSTERQRRQNLNEKYNDLKNLVPNPTKPDRASIVGDAIGYIKELKRTVNELKSLTERKRNYEDRNKKLKTETESIITMKSNGNDDPDESPLIRSSWLQRKSKEIEVDVRIIEDEVTIKLVQRKKMNCLLFVSKVLDELQLDLHHLSGGHIGDYYSYLFNTKMYEGCSVYASAIANKLIEGLDKETVCSNFL